MKLLTKIQTKDVKRMQETKELQRALKVRAISTQETQKLNKVRTQYEDETQKIREAFYTYTNEVERKKGALANEVKGLEERKKEAQKPLDAFRDVLKAKEADNFKEEERLVDKESELDSKDMALNKVKTVLSKDTTSLKRRQTSLSKREEVIADKEAEQKRESTTFSEKREKHENFMREEIKALRKDQDLLKQERGAHRVLKEEHKQAMKRVDDELVRLADQRATLDRAFKRLEK